MMKIFYVFLKWIKAGERKDGTNPPPRSEKPNNPPKPNYPNRIRATR